MRKFDQTNNNIYSDELLMSHALFQLIISSST